MIVDLTMTLLKKRKDFMTWNRDLYEVSHPKIRRSRKRGSWYILEA